MNRLYVVEPTPTITGASADHRLPLAGARVVGRSPRPSPRALGVEGRRRAGGVAEPSRAGSRPLRRRPEGGARARAWSSPATAQPPEVHALAHAINHALGNVGNDGRVHRPGRGRAGRPGRLAPRAGATTWRRARSTRSSILGGNPAYDAPADLDFAEAPRARSGSAVHLGLHEDETSALCHWHVPEAHGWKPGATSGPSTARRRSSSP